jgi:two-component system chemotaxis response regulator CheB
MKKTRVLIVDDSATMRGLIGNTLGREPDIEVVGSAKDPYEARQAIKTLLPDVITLDVEMPRMDGLSFLEKIMRLRPMPVIMVSTLTQHGADISIRALELGAVDCIGKPINGCEPAIAFAGLADKVRAASRARIRPLGFGREIRAAANEPFEPDGRIVGIGASTGGVEALLRIVESLPANCPPTVVVQHMPDVFTRNFAARLDRCSAAEVMEARDGAPLQPGKIYIAPGGANHLEIVGGKEFRCCLRQADPVTGHRPSVDVLFAALAKVAGPNAVGVILTGMGRDGAQGLLAMRQAGATTIGQDQSTCVVFGMPKAAFDVGAVERQLPLQDIGAEILKLCNAHKRDSHASSKLH